VEVPDEERGVITIADGFEPPPFQFQTSMDQFLGQGPSTSSSVLDTAFLTPRAPRSPKRKKTNDFRTAMGRTVSRDVRPVVSEDTLQAVVEVSLRG
jgi:hypothetical protein